MFFSLLDFLFIFSIWVYYLNDQNLVEVNLQEHIFIFSMSKETRIQFESVLQAGIFFIFIELWQLWLLMMIKKN